MSAKIVSKKITLITSDLEVSARFKFGATLAEVLEAVDGLIKALGYSPKGVLDYVDEDL